MGIVGKAFKRSVSNIFDPTFYGILRIAFVCVMKGKNKPGSARVMGFKLHYNNANALLGMYNEIVRQESYRFISSSKSPIILDCGANIGVSMLYFKKLYPNAQLVGVEADPSVGEILIENLKKNGCDAEIIHKALWSRSGDTINFGCAGSDSSSIYSDENVISAETIGIVELLSKYNKVDLLKIDIEGAELEVLQNCGDSLSKVEHLFIEFHSFPSQPQKLEEILAITAKSGFRYKILPAKRMTKPFINKGEDQAMDLQLNIFFHR